MSRFTLLKFKGASSRRLVRFCWMSRWACLLRAGIGGLFNCSRCWEWG